MKDELNKLPSRRAHKGLHRAQRFDIKIPVHFHERNGEEWHEGRTENISRSGLLFRAPEPLPLECMVEVKFALPTPNDAEPGATVLCDGKTIRTILAATSDESPGVAVKILNYRLKRRE